MINAIPVKAIRMEAGQGLGNSAAKELAAVADLATRLQMPIAVALFWKGNILFSPNEA